MNGLGGGGQVDETTSDKSNLAVYATFSVAAFFSGYVVELSKFTDFLTHFTVRSTISWVLA